MEFTGGSFVAHDTVEDRPFSVNDCHCIDCREARAALSPGELSPAKIVVTRAIRQVEHANRIAHLPRVRHAFVFETAKIQKRSTHESRRLDDPTPFAPQKRSGSEDKLPWLRSMSRFRHFEELPNSDQAYRAARSIHFARSGRVFQKLEVDY